MQARYYDPVIGRFYSNDPVGVLGHAELEGGAGYVHGFNRYSYVGNNPYKYTDPTGEHRYRALKNIGRSIEKTGAGKKFNKWVAQKIKQLKENVRRGKEGEQKTREKLGDDIAGEQVTLETKGGDRARVDFVTKDKQVVETKTGDAKLSSGQSKVKEAIDSGEEIIPRGSNAEKAGLTPNQPTKMNGCTVDRHC